MTTALYPGSFDPITRGHLNLIERGLRLFDNLVVAVAINVNKKGLFGHEERIAMIEQSVDLSKVQVVAFKGLLVQYAQECGANAILRGLRAVSDFEYEFQMTHMNRRLAPDIETVFMMTGEDQFFVSSQLAREVAAFGGDVDSLVPPHVARALHQKFPEETS